MAWTDVIPTTSIWSQKNQGETVWDGGATGWDLDGNTYKTVWDGQDNTWSDQAGNSVTWTDQ